MVNENLFEWHVKLHKIDEDSHLAKDMKEAQIPYILLHLVFPDNFPFQPPFMSVISPIIDGGFVMGGGAICCELLTPQGWNSAYTIESVLMQFATNVVKGEGRLSENQSEKYDRKRAEETFKDIVEIHKGGNWYTPDLADG